MANVCHFILLIFVGALLQTFAFSSTTEGLVRSHRNHETIPTATFSHQVNALLNTVELFPHHPFEAVEGPLHEPEADVDLQEVNSKLKKFLENYSILEEMYRNFLEQFCADRVQPKSLISTSFISNRPNIFKENVLQVAEHNVLARQGKIGYEKGINWFSDMTQSELLESYTGLTPTPTPQPHKNHSKPSQVSILDQLLASHNLNLTANDELRGVEFNWATHGRGYVTPVKNQGRCGSCVLFASAAAVESAYLIKNGIELDLSEQEMLDCMKGWPGAYGCKGNFEHVSFEYIQNYGLSLEEDCAYDANDQKICSALEYPHHAHISRFGLVDVEGRDDAEDILKLLVRYYGPIAVSIAVQDDFVGYKNGVYESKCCPHDFNHMVLVVGYGRNAMGVDYWIVKNSWGANWGDMGYVRMRRNYDNLCGIATYPYYVEVD